MKRTAILTAAYASFLVFSLMTLFFGETGVIALNRLQDRNSHLEGNIADLERRREELSARLGALRSDPEAIVVAARSLGLYREGDEVVVFRRSEVHRSVPAAGRVLRMVPAPSVDENLFRVLAAAAGALALLIAFAARRSSHARSPQR